MLSQSCTIHGLIQADSPQVSGPPFGGFSNGHVARWWSVALCFEGVRGTLGLARLPETAVSRHEPLPIACDKPDRCKGAGFRSFDVSLCSVGARYSGALLLSGFRLSGYQRRRSGIVGSFRKANRRRGSVFAAGQSDVAPDSWGRGLHEARPGRPIDGYGFDPRLHRNYHGSHLRGASGSFSVVGAAGVSGNTSGGAEERRLRGRRSD
jgi:hypothetical protein